MKGITLVVVVEMCRFETVPPWIIILAISSICISLALNAIVTGLLVLRIILIHRQCRHAMTQADRRLYDIQVSPVILILIETGMMTFVSQLVFVIVFGLQNASAIVVGSPMVMVYVRSSWFELPLCTILWLIQFICREWCRPSSLCELQWNPRITAKIGLRGYKLPWPLRQVETLRLNRKLYGQKCESDTTFKLRVLLFCIFSPLHGVVSAGDECTSCRLFKVRTHHFLLTLDLDLS